MKRKLIAVLLAMTLTLSCGVVALADEPGENETETFQMENDEDSGKGANVLTDIPDVSKEVKENETENQNPPTEENNTEEKGIPIDEEHFPDEYFREYIKQRIDEDGDGSLNQSELDGYNVRSLFINPSNTSGLIKSLKGIEYFSNMSFLVIDDMSLTSLDVSKNSKLEEIYLRGCQVTNLALNSNLEGLGCVNGSKIFNLDVSNLRLRFLWCEGNLLPGLDSISTLEYIKLYDDIHLPYLDLSKQKNMVLSDSEDGGDNGTPGHHGPLGGAFISPQTISRTVSSVDGVWTLDMASIVGRNYLDRITLVTEGAKMSEDGLVTFQGSEVPKELVYNFDTKNPAETTLMEVTVTLTGVNDQTKAEVNVDTSGVDLDGICKDNNVSPDNVELVVSQETPSKEDADKLAQQASSQGYTVTATYEILLNLFSQGNKIAEITENFGSLTLTLDAGKDYAGRKAVVYQLHNGQEVIVHDGLTVKADGTVTINVDKLSTFAVAVGEKSDSSIDNPVQTPDKTDTSTGDNKPASTDNKNKPANGNSVQTGDESPILMWLLCGAAALGMIAFLQKKRRA